MNTKTILMFVTITVAATLAFVIPSLVTTASAANVDSVCLKNGNTAPDETEPNTALGQADCPDDFKAKPSQSIHQDNIEKLLSNTKEGLLKNSFFIVFNLSNLRSISCYLLLF